MNSCGVLSLKPKGKKMNTNGLGNAPSLSNTLSSTVHLSQKLNKLLSSETTGTEVIKSLSLLSTNYDKNSATSRRKLRGELEKKNLESCQEYLAALQNVQKVCSKCV